MNIIVLPNQFKNFWIYKHNDYQAIDLGTFLIELPAEAQDICGSDILISNFWYSKTKIQGVCVHKLVHMGSSFQLGLHSVRYTSSELKRLEIL